MIKYYRIFRIIVLFASLLVLFSFTNSINSINQKDFSNSIDTTLFFKLKAVLIVGHQEDGTQTAIEKMKKIEEFFKEKGLEVYSFYDKKADWEKIKKESKRANFFIYSGHGTTLGEDGKSGGLCINSRISSKTILEELVLDKNAIVIFKSVCRGAGSSAGDDKDIDVDEAVNRVSDYSKPFFEIGATSYYANNTGGGCLKFLNDFFQGKTIRECYEKTAKLWKEIELEEDYKFDKTKQISIASSDNGGMCTRTTYTNGVKKVEEIPSVKSYSIAYVANPDFSIIDMLK